MRTAEDQERGIVFEAIGTVSPNASMYRGSKERSEERQKKKGKGEEGLVLRKGPGSPCYPFGSGEWDGTHQLTLCMMPSTGSTRLQAHGQLRRPYCRG